MVQRVALTKQPDYDIDSLERSIRRSIDLCGFDLNSVQDKRVLLKPNMLGGYPPSRGITTNPDFIFATAKIFKEAGADVVVGDSTNGVHMPEKALQITGIMDAIERAGVQSISFEASGSENRNGLMISKAPLDADFVINLPKFKTHSLTVLTVAVKNLYGCVNGMQKADLHRRHSDIKDFSKTVVRIAESVRPNLNIVDAITAMEGNGPASGKLKDLGCIIAGRNMHSVDAACCRIIKLDPLKVDTLLAAKNLNHWNDEEGIEIVGDPVDEFLQDNFELPSTYLKGHRDRWFFNFIMKRIWQNVSAKPHIDESKCIKCYLCAKACPVKAIPYDDGDYPKVNKSECIQCFCCHEVCPHKAIEIKQSLLVRIDRFFAERRRKGEEDL